MIETHYYSVTGSGINDCCYLAQRYKKEWGYKLDAGECWVMTHAGDKQGDIDVTVHMGTASWFTKLWQSPTGTIYISTIEGEVYVNRDIRAKSSEKKWKAYDMDEALSGIWGLDDKFVLSWASSWEGEHFLFRFDGKKWHFMPAPDFSIRAMHGMDNDCLYAVGRDGGLAHWNGKKWKHIPTPTGEVLNSVFVVDKDLFYATGANGILLEGSSKDCGKLATSPVKQKPLLAVAKWNDELWIAGGQLGLFKLDVKNKLQNIKSNLDANSFAVGDKLLIGCHDAIIETPDGKKFTGSGEEVLLDIRDGIALGDL